MERGFPFPGLRRVLRLVVRYATLLAQATWDAKHPSKGTIGFCLRTRKVMSEANFLEAYKLKHLDNVKTKIKSLIKSWNLSLNIIILNEVYMAINIIKFDNTEFKYKNHEKTETKKALSKINVKIEKGQFVVVIGRNGSGKSTFARLMNALILPTNGAVYINNFNSLEEENLWDIRQTVGMVFQNPDNQLVATSVEEDVAFGPENLGIVSEEIKKRVSDSLKAVDMLDYQKSAPHNLSGGQKQRIAIAGILAMKPMCIILDEATSMLDPLGRKEVLEVLKKLNEQENITIIHITHHMDEIVYGDRVVIIDEGNIVKDDEPKEVFSDVEGLKKLGLDVPQITELFYELKKEGIKLPTNIIDVDEAVEILKNIFTE